MFKGREKPFNLNHGESMIGCIAVLLLDFSELKHFSHLFYWKTLLLTCYVHWDILHWR